VVPICVALRADGKPCGGAAVRGGDRCFRHSEQEQRTKAQAAADSIAVTPLAALVSLDVSDSRTLKRFRRGIMAHVGRGTLGVSEARALLEVALSIHDSDHKDDASASFTALARDIAEQLGDPGGEGGNQDPAVR
jgi:hypothetical protein